MSRLRSILATVGVIFVCLLGLIMLISGIAGLFTGHDDPQIAGKGRLHDAFIEKQPCSRDQSRTCGLEPSVRLDLPNGDTEVVSQQPLYDLVNEKGPVTVQVEWVESLHSATRVRYGDRWYRAGFPSDANLFEAIVLILLGGALFGFFGLWTLARVLPDVEEEEEGEDPATPLAENPSPS